MQIKKTSNYTLISSDENSLKEFQDLLFEKINDLKKTHIILEISNDIKIENKDFSLFLNVAQQKQQNGTSFVIINGVVNADDYPENLNIVPTFQEAEDILEMEAIERELGF
jgi:hypothetical protein